MPTVPLITLYCVADALAYHFSGVPSAQVNARLHELLALDQRTKLPTVTGQTQLLLLFYNCTLLLPTRGSRRMAKRAAIHCISKTY